MQLQALPGQEQPVLSIKESGFPGSNENKESTSGCRFLEGRCCLGSEAPPVPLLQIRDANEELLALVL